MTRCCRAVLIAACLAAHSPAVALASNSPESPSSMPTPASSLAKTLDARGLSEARVQTPPFIFNQDGTPYRPGQEVDPLGKAPDFWRQLFVWRGALKPPARPLILPAMTVGRLRPTIVPPTAPATPATGSTTP